MSKCSELCLRVLNITRDVVTSHYKDFIHFALLYGSLVYGAFGPLSDIDVALMLKEDVDVINVLPILISDLALALGLPEDKIDITVLNDPSLPLAVRFEALTQGVPIYISDRGVFVKEVVKAISLYGDYQVFLRANAFNELIRRRVSELRGSFK